jgi:peptide/nickel transport system substrate-binding protein
VVRVRAVNRVLGVLVRLPARLRRVGHSAHRTPVRAAAALALVLGALLVPAALQPAAGATTPAKVTFTVALTSDVDSLNPFLGVEANSYEMWALTYDYLVNYSMKDMSPEPGLAKSWETSADGLTWTFHVRDGVKWSDGQPLTAADVAFTYTRVLKGETESTNWSSYLSSVTSATAPDAQTVVLKLSQPNAVLPLLPIPIVPEHIWKNITEKQMATYAAEPKPGQPVVGSGPFRLVEGTAGGSTFRFTKNPDYWNGTPHVDEVDYRVFKTDDPAVQALIKGEVDFVEDIPPLQVKALQGKAGITARNGISPLFEEIGFNTGAINTDNGKPIGDGMAALKDPKFRHALGFAVDNKRIVQNAYQGAALPGDTIIPTAYDNYHWDVPADQAFTFDTAKAGQLLDEAGYKKGADGQRTDKNGKPLKTMRLFARSSSQASINTMDFFKEWLGQVGIKAEVTAMDTSKLGDVILSGDYDAFQWDWYVEPDPDSILSDMTCDQRGGSSDSWYCNQQYDAMYKQQNREMDKAKRVAIVKQMQELLFQESPYLVTAYTTIGEAVRTDRFACFQPQPDPGGVMLIQYGAHNYSSLRPAAQAGDCDGVTSAIGANASANSSDSASSSNTGVWIGIGIVLVLLIGGGVFVAVRRRGTAGERE